VVITGAILFLIIAKKYVAIKDYSSLSYSKIERKENLTLGVEQVVIFLVVVSDLRFHPLLKVLSLIPLAKAGPLPRFR